MTSVPSLVVHRIPNECKMARRHVMEPVPENVAWNLTRIEDIYGQKFQKLFFSTYNKPLVVTPSDGPSFFVLEKCVVCLTAIHTSGEMFATSNYKFVCNEEECLRSVLWYACLDDDLNRVQALVASGVT